MNDQPASPEVPLVRAADKVTTPLHPAAAPRVFRRTGAGIRLFILLLVGILVAVVAFEWDWWVGSAVRQSTDDAYLQADITPLAAKVPGYVRAVLARDFEKVKAAICWSKSSTTTTVPSLVRPNHRPAEAPAKGVDRAGGGNDPGE